MSTIGVLLAWSLRLKGSTASPDEKSSLKLRVCYFTFVYLSISIRISL